MKSAIVSLLAWSLVVAGCSGARHRKVSGPPPEYELPEHVGTGGADVEPADGGANAAPPRDAGGSMNWVPPRDGGPP